MADDDEHLGADGKRSLLSKYDNIDVITGDVKASAASAGFKLGAKGSVDLVAERAREMAAVQARLAARPTVSLESTAVRACNYICTTEKRKGEAQVFVAGD